MVWVDDVESLRFFHYEATPNTTSAIDDKHKKLYDIKPRKVNRNYHEICDMDGLWMDFVCISIVVDAMAFIFDLLQIFFHIRLDKKWLRLHQKSPPCQGQCHGRGDCEVHEGSAGTQLDAFRGNPNVANFGKISI